MNSFKIFRLNSNLNFKLNTYNGLNVSKNLLPGIVISSFNKKPYMTIKKLNPYCNQNKMIYPGDTIKAQDDDYFGSRFLHINDKSNENYNEIKKIDHFNQIIMTSKSIDDDEIEFSLQYHIKSESFVDENLLKDFIKISVNKYISTVKFIHLLNYKTSVNPELQSDIYKSLKNYESLLNNETKLELIQCEIHHISKYNNNLSKKLIDHIDVISKNAKIRSELDKTDMEKFPMNDFEIIILCTGCAFLTVTIIIVFESFV